MKKSNNIKRAYSEPSIEQVVLDNDISLTLDSSGMPWNDPMMNSALDPGFNLMDQPLTTMPL